MPLKKYDNTPASRDPMLDIAIAKTNEHMKKQFALVAVTSGSPENLKSILQKFSPASLNDLLYTAVCSKNGNLLAAIIDHTKPNYPAALNSLMVRNYIDQCQDSSLKVKYNMCANITAPDMNITHVTDLRTGEKVEAHKYICGPDEFISTQGGQLVVASKSEAISSPEGQSIIAEMCPRAPGFIPSLNQYGLSEFMMAAVKAGRNVSQDLIDYANSKVLGKALVLVAGEKAHQVIEEVMPQIIEKEEKIKELLPSKKSLEMAKIWEEHATKHEAKHKEFADQAKALEGDAIKYKMLKEANSLQTEISANEKELKTLSEAEKLQKLIETEAKKRVFNNLLDDIVRKYNEAALKEAVNQEVINKYDSAMKEATRYQALADKATQTAIKYSTTLITEQETQALVNNYLSRDFDGASQNPELKEIYDLNQTKLTASGKLFRLQHSGDVEAITAASREYIQIRDSLAEKEAAYDTKTQMKLAEQIRESQDPGYDNAKGFVERTRNMSINQRQEEATKLPVQDLIMSDTMAPGFISPQAMGYANQTPLNLGYTPMIDANESITHGSLRGGALFMEGDGLSNVSNIHLAAAFGSKKLVRAAAATSVLGYKLFEAAAEYGAAAVGVVTPAIAVKEAMSPEGREGLEGTFKAPEEKNSQEKESLRKDWAPNIVKAWFDLHNQPENITEKRESFLKKHPGFDVNIKNADGKSIDQVLTDKYTEKTEKLLDTSITIDTAINATKKLGSILEHDRVKARPKLIGMLETFVTKFDGNNYDEARKEALDVDAKQNKLSNKLAKAVSSVKDRETDIQRFERIIDNLQSRKSDLLAQRDDPKELGATKMQALARGYMARNAIKKDAMAREQQAEYERIKARINAITKSQLLQALNAPTTDFMALSNASEIMDKHHEFARIALDDKGNTAAHIAAAKGDIPMLQELFSRGANFEATNNAGEKPVDVAKAQETLMQRGTRAVNQVGGFETEDLPAVKYLSTIYTDLAQDTEKLNELAQAYSAEGANKAEISSQIRTFLDTRDYTNKGAGYEDILRGAITEENKQVVQEVFNTFAAHRAKGKEKLAEMREKSYQASENFAELAANEAIDINRAKERIKSDMMESIAKTEKIAADRAKLDKLAQHEGREAKAFTGSLNKPAEPLMQEMRDHLYDGKAHSSDETFRTLSDLKRHLHNVNVSDDHTKPRNVQFVTDLMTNIINDPNKGKDYLNNLTKSLDETELATLKPIQTAFNKEKGLKKVEEVKAKNEAEAKKEWFHIVDSDNHGNNVPKEIKEFLENHSNFDVNTRNSAGRSAMDILAYYNQSDALGTLFARGALSQDAMQVAKSKNGVSSESYKLLSAMDKGQLEIMTYIVNSNISDNSKTELFNKFNKELDAKERSFLLKGTYDKDGNTALHIAAKAGNTALVGALMDAGASTSTQNTKAKTALDLAKDKTVQNLLSTKERDHRLGAMLQSAKDDVRNPFDDQTRIDLANNAKESSEARSKVSVEAAEKYIEKANALKEKAGQDATIASQARSEAENALTEYSLNKLRGDALAAAEKSSAARERLNSEMETKEDLAEAVKLLKAAKEGNLKAISDIIKTRPFLVNFRDRDGSTPLGNAIYDAASQKADGREVVNTLLLNGADINGKGFLGATPLHIAASLDNSYIVQRFVESGANIHIQNNDGKTPEQVANGVMKTMLKEMRERQESIMEYARTGKGQFDSKTPLYLLDLQDKDGNTALHIAAKNGQLDVVKELVSLGADMSIKNNIGQDAYKVAVLPENQLSMVGRAAGYKDPKAVAEFLSAEEQKNESGAATKIQAVARGRVERAKIAKEAPANAIARLAKINTGNKDLDALVKIYAKDLNTVYKASEDLINENPKAFRKIIDITKPDIPKKLESIFNKIIDNLKANRADLLEEVALPNISTLTAKNLDSLSQSGSSIGSTTNESRSTTSSGRSGTSSESISDSASVVSLGPVSSTGIEKVRFSQEMQGAVKEVSNIFKPSITNKKLVDMTPIERVTPFAIISGHPDVASRPKLQVMLNNFMKQYNDLSSFSKEQNSEVTADDIDFLKKKAMSSLTIKNIAGGQLAKLGSAFRETDLEMFDRIVDNLVAGKDPFAAKSKETTQTKDTSKSR